MEVIHRQLDAINEHLTYVAIRAGTNVLEPEMMTTAELRDILLAFNEVATIGKAIVVPPYPAEKSDEWDACLTIIQRVVSYAEELELRPLIAMDNFDVMYDDVNRNVLNFDALVGELTYD